MAKVFMSHVTGEVELVEAFCGKVRSLGHEPVLVEDMPSLGMPPNEKVSYYLTQCEAAVVLATGDPEGGENTRQNIVEEIGRIQQHWSQQHPPWVLFLEVSVRMPSNVGTTWHDLERDNLDPALEMLERELCGLLPDPGSDAPSCAGLHDTSSVPPPLALRPMSDDWMCDAGHPTLPAPGSVQAQL